MRNTKHAFNSLFFSLSLSLSIFRSVFYVASMSSMIHPATEENFSFADRQGNVLGCLSLILVWHLLQL